jgi:tripartite-type tricarboxylate transporter receptor subunit TctC
MKNIRTFGLKKSLLSALLGFGFALGATQAQAQAYPSKPIKAIVPFAAGSATDQIGRAFAQKCQMCWANPSWLKTKPASTAC